MDLQIRPTGKQHLAYQALRLPEIDTLFFGGSAGGGKSWFLCEHAIINCYLYPGYKTFIGREELKRLMSSTFLTFTKVCAYHKIPPEDWHLNGQYNYIEFANGSRIDLLDLKFLPSDPLYERFGSLEYSDGHIEEAGEVDFRAYDVLKSRIGRHLNKELGIKPTMSITGNPKKNWTYQVFYKPFRAGTLPPNVSFIQSLYTDNPFTSEEYGKQLSQITDKALKQRLMFGNWEYDDDPSALINYDAINDLWTNTVEVDNNTVDSLFLTADIARYGQDKTVIMLWRHLECYQIEVYEKQGLDQTAQRIKDLAAQHKIPFSRIIVDEDGVGGGVVDMLRGIKGFVANTQALPSGGKPDNYANLKTQCYYLLADYINSRRIAVKTADMTIRAQLTEELEQVKSKDIDADRKRQLVPKDEIKEILGRSPDFADALMMRMFYELKAPAGTTATTFIPNVGQPAQRSVGKPSTASVHYPSRR